MTQVSWSRQLGLAAALVVMGSIAAWLEYKHKPAQEAKEEQSKKIFSLKDVQVQGVTLKDGSGHVFEIRCSDTTSKLCKPGDNSKWELAQPSKLKADDSNGNSLISALNNLSVAESIDLKEETPEKRAMLLKEYGLDEAALLAHSTRQITVETTAGTTALYLGASHPIGESIFGVIETIPAGQKPSGKIDQNKVYLVPNYFKSNLDHDLTYWRDKKLLTISSHEIDGFELSGSKSQLQGKKTDAQWTLKTKKGDEFPGDIESIDSLLSATTYLTAKKFAADLKTDTKGKAALKGTRQVLTLTLHIEKGSNKETPAPITLTLHKKAESSLFATLSNLDPVYELETSALDKLDKDAKALRLTKLVTSMERFTTKKIEVTGKQIGDKPLVLQNKDGKWIAEGEKEAPNVERVQAMLDKLSGNRIQEFITGGHAKGQDGAILIKLSDEKGELKRQIQLWRDGAMLYARDPASKRDEVYRVDSSITGDLPWTRDALSKPSAPPPTTAPGTPPGDSHGHGHGDGHDHGMEGLPGGPPDPGKALVPAVPEKKGH